MFKQNSIPVHCDLEDLRKRKQAELNVYLNIFVHRLTNHKSDEDFREEQERKIVELHNLVKMPLWKKGQRAW